MCFNGGNSFRIDGYAPKEKRMNGTNQGIPLPFRLQPLTGWAGGAMRTGSEAP
jgi:hypothetical protein